MKFILVYVAMGVFSFSFRTEKKLNDIYGTWKGSYGTEQEVEKVLVTFKPGNKVDLYEGEMKLKNKMSGTYYLQGDKTIVFVYKNMYGYNKVRMYGNLNKTKNFVDGVWEINGQTGGSFYLQKQKL